MSSERLKMSKIPAAQQVEERKGVTNKDEKNEKKLVECAYQPTPRECAMLVVHLIEAKDLETKKNEKKVTRARLSENSLRRLWSRSHLTSSFLVEVQEWLFRAGWMLFFAGSSYAIIKAELVDGWMRISTNRIKDDLRKVSRGKFELEFTKLERVLIPQETSLQDDE